MDKKKTIIRKLSVFVLILATLLPLIGQNLKTVDFCDKKYEYGAGCDTLTLCFNIIGADGKRIADIPTEVLKNYLVVKEGTDLIPNSISEIRHVNTGQRIPGEYTFSILVDLSIPAQGKIKIYKAISRLVGSAQEGSVYLSFFGDEVSSSRVVTKENLRTFEKEFSKTSEHKYLYGSLYAKLLEFSKSKSELEQEIIGESLYTRNKDIAERALENTEKNILFVFTEGNKSPSFENNIGFLEVNDYQQDRAHIVPTVYAFYYTEEGKDAEIENVLMAICDPHIEGRKGDYKPANDMNKVLHDFQEVVNDQMYDYSFSYKVAPSKIFFGKTEFRAEWKGDAVGESVLSIGSAERPWPEHTITGSDTAMKYIVALLVTLLTIVVIFIILKIIIPFVRSKSFEAKYYKKYVPEENISSRVCHYCKQPIQEGQSIVVKCKHYIHVHCWKQNGYKCAEYGQNCNTGIQEHIEWKELFTMKSLKDCHQTIAGVCAGFVSWILFELAGRGCFDMASQRIVGMFYTPAENMPNLSLECIGKTSAFMTIGLLLGFFLSLIFRYNDEYRKKNLLIMLKILGLSILTGVIGLFAFTIGADILCSLLSIIHTSYIPWYCSFPGYLLFSVCVSLSLTIKSSIPLKSALIGGGCSAVIGFIVLYFSSLASNSWPWMNMLLDFVIYGGGLGASLVTVRMLAEKYFLVIKNGVKSGLKIPIHKWMNATGGGNKVSIGMTGDCEIQMNWEKSNKVAKEHAQLYIDHEKQLPMIKPLATGVIYNTRAELPMGRPSVLCNNDTFKIGDTVFQYVEAD
ncbi:MAG: hypothetical protein LUD48_05505 [Prevotella sp.]|nr:hypothetical protein [Prevotella sp.]